MKKRFLSMCLFVVMCLTISSPVLAVYNDDSVVTPNNNRYYYVYEYTNYKCFAFRRVSRFDKKEEIFLFLFIFYVALAVWRRLLFWALQNR